MIWDSVFSVFTRYVGKIVKKPFTQFCICEYAIFQKLDKVNP